MAWVCVLNLLLVLLLPMAGTSTPDAVVRFNNAFLNHGRDLPTVSNIGITPLQRALQFKIPPFVKWEGKKLIFKGIQILSVDVTIFLLEFIVRMGLRLLVLANFSVKIFHIQSRLLVKEHIKAVFKDKICLSISTLVQGLTVYLGTLIGFNPVGPESQILYSMVGAPTLNKNYISLDVKTVLLLLDMPIFLTITDASFTLPEHIGTKDTVITMGLSQQLFDSALLLLQRAGALNMEITGDMKSNDNLLNTSSLGHLIPEVAHQFPQSMPVVIKVRLGATPVAKLHTNNATLQLQPLLEVLAMTSKSIFQSLFSLNVVVNLNLQLSVSKVKIQGTTSVLRDIQLTLAFSNVGVIDMDQVQAFMDTVFEEPLLNHLNALLGMGISLPKVANCYYVDPKVIVHEGFIEISSGLYHQS